MFNHSCVRYDLHAGEFVELPQETDFQRIAAFGTEKKFGDDIAGSVRVFNRPFLQAKDVQVVAHPRRS